MSGLPEWVGEAAFILLIIMPIIGIGAFILAARRFTKKDKP